MARNAFGLALLAALALSGCSKLDNLPFLGNKKAKAAEARRPALRARTDSLRKARRIADSLAQVRYVACVDSVRAELVKPVAVVKKTKAKRRSRSRRLPPSEELIAAQAQYDLRAGCPRLRMTTLAERFRPKPPMAPHAAARSPRPMRRQHQAPGSGRAVPRAAAQPELPCRRSRPSTRRPGPTRCRRPRKPRCRGRPSPTRGSTRDPFNSLLNMAKAGPEVADLQLVGIYQNLRSPSGSVAVFREKEGGKRHKLRAGDQLGRSRVVQIRERDVVFMIEDFGFERQETLSLRKQEDVTP